MTAEFSEGVPPRRAVEPVEPDDFDDESDEPLPALARPSSEDVAFAICSHWGGFLSAFIAPLILYLVQRDRRSLGAWHAREAFNFQLTLGAYYIIDVLLCGLAFIDWWLLLVPAVFAVVVTLFEFVVIVWATVAAVQKRFFRCPLTIPFIPRPPLGRDAYEYFGRE